MHRKFDFRRYLTAFFVGIFAIVGTVVAIDAPANAFAGDDSEIDFALSLGANQALSTPDASALDLSENFTFQFWYKADSSAYRMILNKENAYEIGTDANGKFGYALQSGGSWDWHYTTQVIPNGRWVHVAFTKASTVTKLYFDGQQVWTQTGGGTSTNSNVLANPATITNQTSHLMIGGRATNNTGIDSAAGQANGLTLDEFEIWNTALGQSDIATGMHTKVTSGAAGLVAYWNFNEGTTSNTSANNYDRGGNNFHLTFFGTPTVTNGNFVDVKTTSKANGKTVITFPRTYLPGLNGWKVPAGVTRATLLAVAGGGSGGTRHAGGGGAGALQFDPAYSLTPGAAITIQVGQGGLGQPGASGRDTNALTLGGVRGQATSVGALELLGGGAGEGGGNAATPGGSSGGKSGPGTVVAVGTGAGLRNTGAQGIYINSNTGLAGGGGGGAGSTGYVGNNSAAGKGGDGIEYSITGTPICYAAGGGGGVADANASGGEGGDGCVNAAATGGAGSSKTAAFAATPNTGSGGGGGGYNQASPYTDQNSGSGGSGIVVVAYAPVDDNYMNFNGASQYAVASGAQVIPSTGSFTVEAWINPISSGAPSTAIIASQGTGSNRFYMKRAGGNLVTYRDQASQTTEVNCGALPADQWVHVAVSYTGNNVYCFINGALVSTPAFAFGVKTVGTNFYVGQYSAAPTDVNSYWKGAIDQVKVWNTAITDSALISRSMNSYADQDTGGYIAGSSDTPALTHLFAFNEASGAPTISDMVGSATLSTAGSPTSAPIVATTSNAGNSVYKFPRTFLNGFGGWFPPAASSSASVLVVAGGGGGGGHAWAGGGGAGAMLEASGNQTLTTSSPTKIIVGQGGLGGSEVSGDEDKGKSGGNSTFGTAVALGGGAGGGFGYSGFSRAVGSDGGSGGGHSEFNSTIAAKASIQPDVAGFTKRGFAGGAMTITASQAGSGGGGAGSAGTSVTSVGVSGDGGAGFQSNITGVATFYAGGGAGGKSASETASLGGSSIGGNGGSSSTAPTSGAANTGSGGGGTGNGSSYVMKGGSGGSGVVIVSVKTANTITFNGNGGTSTLAVQNITVGGTANLSTASGTVTRSGYTFTGWNTQSNNYGTAYEDEESVTPSNDMTLYAQWIPTSPILYFNFSDRDSTHDGTTAVTNLGSNSALTGTKVNTPSHDYSNGTLNFTGTTYANGSYVDVADITTNQFAGGITLDFEADFGSTAENWERVLDFGVNGQTSSNILVSRSGTSSNIVFEIYDGSNSQGYCSVPSGIPASAQMIRWTFTLDGTNCRVWKDGVAQTVSTAVTPGYSLTQTPAFAHLPTNNVTWTTNYLAKSNWSADASTKMALRSFRLYAGVLTPSQVGAITYRTINFDANYTGSSSLTSRYTSGKTTLQTAPNRSGYTFSGWYDNIVSTSGTLIGGSGAVYSPLSTSMNLFGAWASNVAAQAPTISGQPAGVTKSAGETATFSVSAAVTDSGTLSYQWQVSTNSGSTWASVSGGSGATTSSYTTPTLVSGDDGNQYRVVVTNTLSGSTAETTSNAATLTIGLDKINVNFDELNFDYSNVLHVVGTNGKSVGNKVLFLNVTTKNGVQVDALVTTETLTSAVIKNYEAGANAGGSNSYFQTDVDINATNGFAQFKFDFYKHGVTGSAGNPCTVANPSCTGATKVVIQNVNVSAIDIDANQWNDFTLAESYTLAGNTKLKECEIPNTGTCTKRLAPTTFPANMRFQGDTSARSNDPVDMAIVTYAEIETFRIKFGRSTQGSPNYYGVAFKALDWGDTTPQTKGGTDYTISYNVNSATSGSQTGTHVGAAGSSFTVLSAGTAVKSGYTFAGWATSSSATTADYAASSKVTMPGSNLTLYAVWTPIKYTLTYNVNGGSGAPAAGSFETGTNNVTLSSTVPTRTGYVFGGWDTVVNSGTGNTNYDSGDSYSMPSSNTTLYAKWTIANGTLSYNGNSGTTTQASVTAAGNTTTTVASGSNTNRTGYDFAGWNSKADGTGTSYAVGSTFTLKANETTTVYAQWTLSKYNLTFNVNGGVGTPQTKSYVQGATTTMPVSNPTRDGFTFGGWNSLADGTGTNYTGSFLMPGNALTLYAKWTPITYNVTYNNNSATYSGASGSVTDANTYTAAQSVTVAAATGLTNVTGGVTYRFVGWNTAANGTGTDYVAGATFAMPAANTTLYAMWLDASVEIAYNANGGTGAPANDNAVINTRYDIRTGSPTKPGNTFGGWLISDGSPAGTYKVGGTDFFSPDSNFETLVAQWTAINYTIEYNTDGGSTAPADMTNKNIGDIITINSTPPTKSGYTFLGWKDAAGNIYPAGGTFILGAGNVTLTAQWQGTPYTLTYDANSGTGAPSAETRNYNESANLSTVEPTRTGYTFQGWNTLVNGNGTPTDSGDPFQMPSADTTLFAQWTVNDFLLAYNTQGGSTPPSGGSTNFDATVTVNATPPTKTGHTFAGWNTVVGGTGTTYLPSGTFKMPNENVTLYAQWTKTAYTLYYNTNGGQGVFSSQPVKYGESVTVDSTTPTKTGYTFSGWNTAADGTSGNDFNPMSIFTLSAESNVTLYAKWTPISYSLAYNANTGAGAPTGGSYNFGATVTTANKGSMNLTDYRFIGWNTRADGSGITYIEGATFAMPAENVILYAQWISSLYQIAYNANGGSGGPEGAIANDSTTYNIDPIEPVRPGYTFSGWKLADGTPTANALKVDAAPLASSFVVSGDELLVAQWTIKTITVTYDLNGGSRDSALSPASGNYATNVTLAASSGITRANFQFVGWSSTPDGTGTTYVDGSSYKLPAEDVILYAKWAPVYYVIEYNPAGGSGEPADQFATPSSTVAIATQEPSKSGYEFDKWTEVSQGTDFTPGSTLTMPSSNVVLVANYSVRAASVPGSGSGGSVEAIKPTTPVNKPKELNLTVYFQGDSSVLIPRTKLALQKIAKLAKSYGRANNITIYGRVKLTNDKSYDMKLSKARAANVAAYLKKFGVTGSFKVYAKGIAPENNFRARRVEVKLWWAK